MSPASASLLTIPCELRNAIYLLIFTPEPTTRDLSHPASPLPNTTTNNNNNNNDDNNNAIATVLRPQYDNDDFLAPPRTKQYLEILRTCRQIHDEAHVLAQSMATFHVVGDASDPLKFEQQIARLRGTKISAIRNITLTARISKLRSLNESWQGMPFGNPLLKLDTLTIVPKRPDANYSAYAEIAYHSQAHTLAHLFAETFKGLRNVGVVRVRNEGCFNDFFWELMYKGLILRLWNWAGHSCGVKFLECKNEEDGPGEQWFQAWMREGEAGWEEAFDVGHELRRFLGDGIELPEPRTFAI